MPSDQEYNSEFKSWPEKCFGETDFKVSLIFKLMNGVVYEN